MLSFCIQSKCYNVFGFFYELFFSFFNLKKIQANFYNFILKVFDGECIELDFIMKKYVMQYFKS